ncbi:MAG: XdhC family protein [Kofleriaceae bacterium]
MKREVLEALREARREGRPVVLATWLSSGAQRLLEAPAERDDARSAAVAGVLQRDRAEVLELEGGEVLLEPHNPPLRLILIGAVHLARALGEAARLTGFAVTIVDPRRAFATEERFPGYPLLTTWPDDAVRALRVDARTAVVTLTHDPKLDDPALLAALETPAFYLGCLGSKKTHQARLERLRAHGLGEDALRRLHGPVGLPIGARAPAEIAISILAQLIATLRGAA